MIAAAVFTADLVMGWSTSIIAPTIFDGNLNQYMASLERLLELGQGHEPESRDIEVLHPGHGESIKPPLDRMETRFRFAESFEIHRSPPATHRPKPSKPSPPASPQFPVSPIQMVVDNVTRIYTDCRDGIPKLHGPQPPSRSRGGGRTWMLGLVEVVEEGTSAAVDEPGPLSDQEEENRRFWTAVLCDYTFADEAVEPPAPRHLPTIHVLVTNSGFGGWALSFTAYINRNDGSIGCFVMCRKGHPREQRIFDETLESLQEWREPLGGDVKKWEQGGRPRFGYWREDLSFLSASEDSEEYQEAVDWIRQQLDRLVSALHHHFQERLASD